MPSKLNETVVKEVSFIICLREFSVFSTVLVSSVVSEPNIITLVGNNVSQTLFFHEAPGISITKETML
jgi:hypothetical protein